MDVKLMSNLCENESRTLLPGSECLYLKFYCTANNCDYLLRQVISPFITSHRNRGLFTKWFFIRYGDPNWHLRLRFFGAPDRLLGEVLPYFSSVGKTAFEAKRIYKMDIGTYNREIERYGGVKAIFAAESLFEIDSEAVLKMLNIFISNEFLSDRWKIALVGVDRLLDDFGLNVADKMKIMTMLCAGFENEFKVENAFKESLSRRFRIERPELTQLLMKDGKRTALQSQGQKILEWRSEKIKDAIEMLKITYNEEIQGQTFNGIIRSMVHMHLNRLLRSAHRAQELVIYNFLLRLYRSMNAQESN
jgi:thiopeptide-type bacteriocin biosynthesis protein